MGGEKPFARVRKRPRAQPRLQMPPPFRRRLNWFYRVWLLLLPVRGRVKSSANKTQNQTCLHTCSFCLPVTFILLCVLLAGSVHPAPGLSSASETKCVRPSPTCRHLWWQGWGTLTDCRSQADFCCQSLLRYFMLFLIKSLGMKQVTRGGFGPACSVITCCTSTDIITCTSSFKYLSKDDL